MIIIRVRKFASIFFVMSLFSCIHSPYVSEEYVNKDLKNVYADIELPSRPEFDKYYINEAFIKLYLSANKQDGHSARPPYRLIIWPTGLRGVHEKLVIHSIEIISSLNNLYYVPKDLFPVVLDFSDGRKDETRDGKPVCHINYVIQEPYFFQVNDNEIIRVKIEITVEAKEGVERKQIIHEFTPKITKGKYRMISR